MDWSTICQHAKQLGQKLVTIKHVHFVGDLFIVTNDQNMEHLEELVHALPEWRFNIATFTPMGWELTKMCQYSNVFLYPIVLSYRFNELFDKSACYLDINYGKKILQVSYALQKRVNQC